MVNEKRRDVESNHDDVYEYYAGTEAAPIQIALMEAFNGDVLSCWRFNGVSQQMEAAVYVQSLPRHGLVLRQI